MKNKILIVDDEPNILKLLTYSLGKSFDIQTAKSASAAFMTLLNNKDINLVVTDIMMPEIDGFELVKNIRSLDKFNKVPIIFLSAKNQSTDRINGLKLGADDYMVKPFNPEELEIRIENILRKITQ